jgi:hypothetical protein
VLLEQQQQQEQEQQQGLSSAVCSGADSRSASALAGGWGSEQQEQQQPIVYVANDWPTALLLLRLQYSIRAAAASPAADTSSSSISSGSGRPGLRQLLVQRLGVSAVSAYCIHNLAYQGLLAAEAFPRLGLPLTALPALCTSDSWQQVLRQLGEPCGGSSLLAGAGCSDEGYSQQLEGQQAAGDVAIAMGAGQPGPQPSGAAPAAPAAAAAAEPEAGSCVSGQLNQMRSALLTADCLVTVSPGYAAEVQQEGPFGCGLHDILAARGIRCTLPLPLPSSSSPPLAHQLRRCLAETPACLAANQRKTEKGQHLCID